MTKNCKTGEEALNQAKPVWSAPKLGKLGKMADVAGPRGAGGQAAGGGQNRS